MKRKSVLVLAIGIILILSGCVASFVQSFAKDVSSTKENQEVIEKDYKSFKDLMESFNGDRELLYENVINNLYIEDVSLEYINWVSTYQEYEKTINKTEEYKDMLTKRCIGILYSDSNIQSKCDSMLISYETAINYYVKDVNKFNEFLEKYNNQSEESNKVELFDLKQYNYIDFDDDGKYLGK